MPNEHKRRYASVKSRIARLTVCFTKQAVIDDMLDKGSLNLECKL